ncbi:MAG: SUMF1/EgtB/PvdO family nonheme iron enzyme, partial [Treponema sp.]|nr:SUMF1/EgtB/PvdO family nonheme iron enzyme [Treponema sp.]
GDNYPVYYVNWFAAVVFCNKLSIREGLKCAYSLDGKDESYWQNFNYSKDISKIKNDDCNAVQFDISANGYRLPTEVEWEYAARSGKKLESYDYSGSNVATDVAWINDNSDASTHPVKTDKIPDQDSANSLGLYDMTGNVNEWCWDLYNTTIDATTLITGPNEASSNSSRAMKGAGWDTALLTAAKIDRRVGNIATGTGGRANGTGTIIYYGFGFRVVRKASTYPLLVNFDTTANWPENTTKLDAAIVNQTEKKVSVPDYDVYRYGYTLKGWYTSATPAESDEPFNFNTPITDNITLYAVWKSDFVLVEGMTFDSTNASKLAILYNRELTVNDFYLCDHEVTQKEWQDVMGALPAEMSQHPQGEGDNYPVYYVNWYAAIVYCNKLSIREGLDCAYSIDGKDESYWQYFNYSTSISSITAADCNKVQFDMSADGYRLPTEIEWEYAARGGKNLENYTFSGGNDYTTIAWVYENSESSTHPVKTDKISGTDSANSLGLYDMCGNVNEWCWDFYNATLDTTIPITGPDEAPSDSKRAKRGGGWDSVATSYATIDRRSGSTPTETGGSTTREGTKLYYGLGFRVAKKASTYPLLVKFDTTSNYSGNTSKVDSILITGADKKAAEPSYSVKKNGYALKGWYTTANPTETDSPFNFDSSITESITLYAVWYAPASVGDVLLTDGSIISYKAGRTFTDTEKANAVGVLYGFDEKGAPMGWVAKYHTDTHTGYVWATNDVTLGGTGFESIACTRTSESNNVDEGVTFEGDLDGSDNWEKVCEADTTAESNPAKYPVFDYVNKYGKDPTADYYFGGYLSETEYKDGWYLPSIAELACLFKNRKKINDVLETLNEDGKPKNNTHYYSCWSSSLSQDASKCWVVTSNDWGKTGYVDEINKNYNDSYRVIPVHK